MFPISDKDGMPRGCVGWGVVVLGIVVLIGWVAWTVYELAGVL